MGKGLVNRKQETLSASGTMLKLLYPKHAPHCCSALLLCRLKEEEIVLVVATSRFFSRHFVMQGIWYPCTHGEDNSSISFTLYSGGKRQKLKSSSIKSYEKSWCLQRQSFLRDLCP